MARIDTKSVTEPGRWWDVEIERCRLSPPPCRGDRACAAGTAGGAARRRPGRIPGRRTPRRSSRTRASAPSLPFEGGQVTISIDVLDDLGVAMVYADVFESGGSGQSVQLFPSVIHPSGWITYSGSGVIGPELQRHTRQLRRRVQAWDTNGATASAVAGEINVDAQPQFDEPPTVADPTVDPRDLGSAGGPVTIAVTAYDLRGISEAYATISPAAGATSYVPLDPISSSRFQGVLNVPANTGTAAVQYAIEITALDDIGQPASVDAGLVDGGRAVPRRPGTVAAIAREPVLRRGPGGEADAPLVRAAKPRPAIITSDQRGDRRAAPCLRRCRGRTTGRHAVPPPRRRDPSSSASLSSRERRALPGVCRRSACRRKAAWTGPAALRARGPAQVADGPPRHSSPRPAPQAGGSNGLG